MTVFWMAILLSPNNRHYFYFIYLILCCPLIAKGSNTIQISLSQNQQNQWQAHFKLPKKAKSLAFIRSPNNSRSKRWQPTDANFVFSYQTLNSKDKQKYELVKRKDNKAFNTVSFNLTANYTVLPKDYAPFMPFSDGGIAIYTGRFFVCSDDCINFDNNWQFKLQANSQYHIISNGKLSQTTSHWQDKDNGQYIYVGPAKPISTSHFNAIIDSALPTTIKQQLSSALPKFMDYFAAKLNSKPKTTVKPLLFASYGQAHDGKGRQGGTLPNQVFVHWYGKELKQRLAKPNAISSVLWFFAHEAAHFYQHTLFDNQFAWLHEGSAEYMAFQALNHIMPTHTSYTQTQLEKAQRNCQSDRATVPLRKASKQGKFKMHYHCGLVIWHQIAAQLKSQNSPADIYTLWRQINQTTLLQPQTSQQPLAMFYRLLSQQTNHNFSDKINRFINKATQQ